MFRDKFENQRCVVGSWIQIASASVCEIAARQGLDWIAVDKEHTEIGFEIMADMFRGLKGTKTVPFVRVASNDALEIRRSLDIGALGIIVPLVETAAEAKRAVGYCKYPPAGERGFAFCRANNWGEDFDEYVEKANEETMVFVMIESKKAVENIDKILETEGLDGVFIGAYDMSASYGVVGRPGHQLVNEACDKVVAACKKHNKIAGIHIVNPEINTVKEHIEKGFKFIAVGIDTLFLRNGIKEIVNSVKESY